MRAVPTDTFARLSKPSTQTQTAPHTIGLLPFREKIVRAVIHEAKYHGNEKAFELLAEVVGDYVKASGIDLTRAVLVPIPLGAKRRSARGYNQVEEVLKRVSKNTGVPVSDVLVRTRETVSQVSLPREMRKENTRSAFGAAGVPSPTLTYIVCDDVITTGSTLQAAIDALASGGGVHILPLAFAY